MSELGSAVGAGALSLVAVIVLNASTLQVALLAALSGVAGAILAVPAGPWVEFRRKRPVMIGTDLVRVVVLGSVPAAAAVGSLTYAQLCVVGVVQAVCAIVYAAASGAHLKALVGEPQRLAATSRMEATLWTAISVGPPIGGLLVSWLGATTAIAVDVVSFALSALGVRRLRTPEPAPPTPARHRRWASEVTMGWRAIGAHPVLRLLFGNAMVFGGPIMAISPVLAVLMLRDLGLRPWQYGLALGLPGLGGIAGALLAKPLVRRFGQRRVLLAAGLARTPWMLFLPLAPPGTPGLIVITVADMLLLASAGVFNPAFATYRMNVTPDAVMTRVLTAWSISSRLIQPIVITAAGLLATAISPRTTLTVLAALVLTSALLLPWRTDTTTPAPTRHAASRAARPPTSRNARR
ncbi:MFS transporter [Luedemannella flava]|uniref:MFS transporter n=1 Tax=Luedemannella flava TaxID=349316 RepID=A0ABP4Y3C6_9ACTN